METGKLPGLPHSIVAVLKTRIKGMELSHDVKLDLPGNSCPGWWRSGLDYPPVAQVCAGPKLLAYAAQLGGHFIVGLARNCDTIFIAEKAKLPWCRPLFMPVQQCLPLRLLPDGYIQIVLVRQFLGLSILVKVVRLGEVWKRNRWSLSRWSRQSQTRSSARSRVVLVELAVVTNAISE